MSTSPVPQNAPVRVLVIDDDSRDALLAMDLLTGVEGTSCAATWASSASAGLKALRGRRHDAVLVDVNLGGESGLDLVRAALAEGIVGPYILLTGHGSAEVDREAIAAGADDFLLKSEVSPGSLHRAIRYARERLAARVELERRGQQILASNQELEQYARAVSHELRAPLQVIAGNLDLIRITEAGRLSSGSEASLARAINGVARAESLISDLLAYARLDGGGAVDDPVDVAAAVDAVLGDLSAQIAAAGATLRRSELPTVSGNRAQIELLFRNLVANALKFRGERAPEVDILASPRESGWRFEVRDNGIGIRAEDRQRVFDLFTRLHPESRFAGTGIGLALCRKVVERHGGTLAVAETPGGGSTFSFVLAPAPT